LTGSNAAAAGISNLTITGTSGALTSTTHLALTVSPATVSGFACHVGYTLGSEWPGGFGAAITINNTGTTSISNWTLTWTFANGQTVTQLWNGIETQSGANVSVTNESYNGTIASGGSYSGMGFNGAWNNTTNAVPTAFAVNGVACQ
jgi:endo-1,4-beta-xylanase